MNGGKGLDERDIELTKAIALLVFGGAFCIMWMVMIVLDWPGVLWDEGYRMLLPIREPNPMNPLILGLGLLGWGALKKPKKPGEDHE